MTQRPQMTVGMVKGFLAEFSDDTLVFCAPSTVNDCEPEETQEFIEDDEKIKCVSMEKTNEGKFKEYLTFGFAG